MQKNTPNLKQRYDLSRHHAWAGTVLLSMLLALRLLLEIPTALLILSIILLTGYILTSLFFTYKYRQGLLTNIHNKTIISSNLEQQKIAADIQKEQVKLEKKKAKTEAKKQKKAQKK